MPELKKILIQDFRNIAFQELDFSPNANCISGGNGEGKTNLLDAIWTLSMTKSAFASNDKYNIRYDCNSFSLLGHYQLQDGSNTRIALRLSPSGEKQLKRDDKAYGKLSEHIGLLPIVMVSPDDSSMICDGGEQRRRFVNSVLSQTDHQYLLDMQQYRRILAQRNTILKQPHPDPALLDTFDAQLEAPSVRIGTKRAEFCEQLAPLVARFYKEISAGKEEAGIEYRSDLRQFTPYELLQQRRERDLALGYTSAGVHRDDFVFLMDGHPIQRAGSQGQQKSYLVALKFAQHELMRIGYGFPPIMLLDDLFDKLDPSRVNNLLGMVADRDFGQIFLSDPDPKRTRTIVDAITDDRSYIEAKGGAFTIQDE